MAYFAIQHSASLNHLYLRWSVGRDANPDMRRRIAPLGLSYGWSTDIFSFSSWSWAFQLSQFKHMSHLVEMINRLCQGFVNLQNTAAAPSSQKVSLSLLKTRKCQRRIRQNIWTAVFDQSQNPCFRTSMACNSSSCWYRIVKDIQYKKQLMNSLFVNTFFDEQALFLFLPNWHVGSCWFYDLFDQ